MTTVFLSYSRHDSEFVQRLCSALAKREFDPWVDWKNIPLTAAFLDEIQRGIAKSDAFLFVVSPHSVSSDICRLELDYAIRLSKRLVPLICQPVGDDAVPASLKEINWIRFDDGAAFEQRTDELARAVRMNLEWVHSHTRLLVRADEWNRMHRDSSLLLTGRDLVATERLVNAAQGTEPSLAELQREYLQGSRRAALVRPERGGFAFGVAAFLSTLLIGHASGFVYTFVVLTVSGIVCTIPFKLPLSSMLLFCLSRVLWFEALLSASRMMLYSFTPAGMSLRSVKYDWNEANRTQVLLSSLALFCLATAFGTFGAWLSPLLARLSAVAAFAIASLAGVGALFLMQRSSGSFSTDSSRMYFVLSDMIGWATLGACFGILPLNKASVSMKRVR